MKNSTHIIITLSSIILLVLSSIALGYVANGYISIVLNKIQNEYTGTPEECVNLTLVETTRCLNNYVKTIYQYNLTQDLIKLSEEKLIENGGDCKNWAELYDDYAKNLGFYSEIVEIITGEYSAHMFTVISDETGYCVLDQRLYKCFKLSEDNKMENIIWITEED